MKIIYLKPLSGYATPLRSDTLWGMLCWGIRHLYGESKLTSFLESCRAGQPPFIVTSTFPCKQYGKEWIPFFPNPLPFPDEHDDDMATALKNAELRKKYKKEFAFVNLDDFSTILNGNLTAKDLRQRLRDVMDEEERLHEESKRTGKRKKERTILENERVRTAPRLEDFSMTHNTIDRLRGGTLSLPVEGGTSYETAGQLFHSPETFWTDRYADPNQDPNTGIFFLADGTDLSLLEPVLRLFRHWGFGADRTTGKGFFDFEIQDFSIMTPSDANAMMTLSLFRPSSDELTAIDGFPEDDKRFKYRIELREGRVGHLRVDLKKQAHRFFTEGSVFPLLPDRKTRYWGGLIHQFDKPHPIWDNGFGFMVHLKWQ